MYLAFTPVGQTAIVGVQARYYLPILWLAIVAAYNGKLSINMTKQATPIAYGNYDIYNCIWTFDGINRSKAGIEGKAFTKSDFVKPFERFGKWIKSINCNTCI